MNLGVKLSTVTLILAYRPRVTFPTLCVECCLLYNVRLPCTKAVRKIKRLDLPIHKEDTSIFHFVGTVAEKNVSEKAVLVSQK